MDDDLFSRYLRGSKTFDNLYQKGSRCRSNPAGAACRCKKPTQDICFIFIRVKEISTQIGGEVAEILEKMT